jgi:hypothetical protein
MSAKMQLQWFYTCNTGGIVSITVMVKVWFSVVVIMEKSTEDGKMKGQNGNKRAEKWSHASTSTVLGKLLLL